MPDHAAIRHRVKVAVSRALRLSMPPDEIPDNEVLFGEGAGPDSVVALELVFALEDEFGFEVDDDELGAELFDSVNTLIAYVKGKAADGRLSVSGLHRDETDR